MNAVSPLPFAEERASPTHFLKVDEGIDVAPLLAQLEAHPDLWDAISYRRTGHGTPHAQMTDIWVRYDDLAPHIKSGDFELMRKPFTPIWYPAWKVLTELRPIVFDLMRKVQGEMLGGIFITKIPAGGKIARHVDTGWHPSYFHQFYLSVKSAPGAEFVCEHEGVRESINPKVGEVWRFKNTKLDWVNNDSASERITVIIAIRTELFDCRVEQEDAAA